MIGRRWRFDRVWQQPGKGVMNLDIQRPTLVITGQWNPAIFDPSWVARHLFGLTAGTEMSVTQVWTGNKITNYFGALGLAVSNSRVEIFLNEFEPENQATSESLLTKVATVLPHTPVQAMGVNFHFLESDVSAELVDKLKTHEQIETRFEVSGQSIISVIKMEGAELNLRRDLLGQNLEIDFNFHYPLPTGLADVPTLAQGCIGRLYEGAKKILVDVYDLDTSSINFVGHAFPASPIG
jgi:hypothetical protein